MLVLLACTGAIGVPAGEAVAQQQQPAQPLPISPATAAPQPATPDASQRGFTYSSRAGDSGPALPAISFQLGKWGSAPSNFPYADSWSSHGRSDDMACNMPSSPCVNEDRE
jgi:hypothetical protein